MARSDQRVIIQTEGDSCSMEKAEEHWSRELIEEMYKNVWKESTLAEKQSLKDEGLVAHFIIAVLAFL